jgi:signal peptidase I
MSTVALSASGLPRRLRLRTVLTTVLTLVLVAGWTVFLRPQALGGPTAVVVVSGTSMQPSLHTGDVVLVHRRPSYRVGDVIAYRVPKGDVGAGSVIIHRITGGSAATGFVVRGDNRSTVDQWRPRPADVMGARWADLPTSDSRLTWLRTPIAFGVLAAAFAFVLVAFGGSQSRRGDSNP